MEPVEDRTFKFTDLVAEGKRRNREFAYESETARNFDDSNIKRAKVGVKELIEDAINKAKSQVGDIKSKAYKEGFDEGFLDGLKQAEVAAKQDFDPFLVSLQDSIAQLSVFRSKMYDKLEREMMEMVIELVKRIIRFELATREDSVQSMIELAIQSVLDRENLTIKIHPEDKGYAESFRPELHSMFNDIKNIAIEAHPGVQRGGCVIQSNFGVIDAQLNKLDDQINRILNLTPAEFTEGTTESLPDIPEEDTSAATKADEISHAEVNNEDSAEDAPAEETATPASPEEATAEDNRLDDLEDLEELPEQATTENDALDDLEDLEELPEDESFDDPESK